MTTHRLHRVLWAGLATLAVTGCKSSTGSPPSAFGVDITVDASMLSSAQRQAVTDGYMQVSGAETFATRFAIVPAISSGQLRFQFVPKIAKAGDKLSFHVDAVDAAGKVYGSGDGAAVTLTAGAVAENIVLAAAAGTLVGDGAHCTADTQCVHGHCADGLCCNMACAGVLCMACNLTDTPGLCVPAAEGTDPHHDCQGFSPTGTGGSGGSGGAGGKAGAAGGGGAAGASGATGAKDAGTADAGQTINEPDGGVMAMPNKCGGTCNGAGACKYADKGTVCGTPFCNNHRDLANITCDGHGVCGFDLESCPNGFGCQLTSSPGMCRTSCSIDAECQSGFFCSNGQCVAQKSPGKTCAADGECDSNHCATGVCCKTACASPNSCDNTGVCKCTGVTCNSGVSCAVFYPDADVDSFGDKSATATTTPPTKIGCADTPPAGYVADNTDCDDKDANVHPGQTGYFTTTSKGVGTFDYNCDGMQEKSIPEYPGATCKFCPSACGGNGCSDPTSTTCASMNAQASLSCAREGGICPILLNPTASEVALPISTPSTQASSPVIIISLACCGCNDHGGFTATGGVGCGLSSNTYTTCGSCSATGGTQVASVTSATQACH